MRLIVFFDLPVIDAIDRRIYSKFHKYLVLNGYSMMQYSIYVKIFTNREAIVRHLSLLKNNLPKEGSVRSLMVTEKQYASIEILVGGTSKLEEKITANPFIVF